LNAVQKIIEMKKDTVKKYNNYRAQIWLPKMTEDIYLNQDNKIALYSYQWDTDKYIEARKNQLSWNKATTNTKKSASWNTYTW
jgi:hypothetical protein